MNTDTQDLDEYTLYDKLGDAYPILISAEPGQPPEVYYDHSYGIGALSLARVTSLLRAVTGDRNVSVVAWHPYSGVGTKIRGRVEYSKDKNPERRSAKRRGEGPDMQMSLLVEVDATELFEDDGPNWQWCKANANFAHRNACEFIVHCTPGYWELNVEKMRADGCTEDFIGVYSRAAQMGAARVLFYV